MTDEMCIEQMEIAEILEMVEYQKKQAFEEGQEKKIEEIKGCLKI